MAYKRGDVLQVDWGDAFCASGWYTSKPKDCAPLMVTCVGGLVISNKKGVLLTFGFTPDGKNLGEMFIPRGMIKKIKLLIPSNKVKTSY